MYARLRAELWWTSGNISGAAKDRLSLRRKAFHSLFLNGDACKKPWPTSTGRSSRLTNSNALWPPSTRISYSLRNSLLRLGMRSLTNGHHSGLGSWRRGRMESCVSRGCCRGRCKGEGGRYSCFAFLTTRPRRGRRV